MLKNKKDPWARDSHTMGDFVRKGSTRNPCWGKVTDAEALRDINYDD